MPTNKNTPTHGQLLERDPARRRARLDWLCDIRSRLAIHTIERRSHGLDDTAETHLQLMAVEATIDREYPETFTERFAAWVEEETRLEHDPNWLHPECGICQAIANRSGINLDPPEAA